MAVRLTKIALFMSGATSALATQGKGEKKRSSAIQKLAAFGGMVAGSSGAAVPHNPVAGLDTAQQLQYHQAELKGLMHNEGEMKERFNRFAADFGRDYIGFQQVESPLGEYSTAQPKCKPGMEAECTERYEMFKANVEIAHSRNIEGKGQVVHGITKFMDYTPGEFNRFSKGLDSERALADAKTWKKFSSTKKGVFLAQEETASGSKDWRDDGIITPVKDQGQCGSCWAHSVVEQTESMAIKAGQVDKTWKGSPQELVSCDKASVDNGCNGGSTLFGFDYLLTHGLESESDYPYTSGTTKVDGVCQIDPSEEVIESAGEGSLFDGEDEMTKYALTQGPVSIAVDASKWSTYVSGIFPSEQCDGQIDHAVQAIGLNTEADKPYWIVRNSWNTNWGEDGFIRIPHGENACSIGSMAATWDTKKVSTKQEGSKIKINLV